MLVGLGFWTVKTFTTVGESFATKSAKSSDKGWLLAIVKLRKKV